MVFEPWYGRERFNIRGTRRTQSLKVSASIFSYPSDPGYPAWFLITVDTKSYIFGMHEITQRFDTARKASGVSDETIRLRVSLHIRPTIINRDLIVSCLKEPILCNTSRHILVQIFVDTI